LWFKQIVHELRHLRAAFLAADSARAVFTLKRVLTIMKTLVGQVDILETMTPLSFNAFRSRLEAASGFQSAQFREIEFLLGHKRIDVLDAHPEGENRDRLARLLGEPSVYDAFLRYLDGCGHSMPAAAL